MEDLLFQTSLVAAFVAGMVALFAPCCITFLLPAYLGSVFKEKEKVLLMTVVFGLGIFVVLLPAVLGVSLISTLLFRYHDSVYLAGGFVMLLVSVVSFLGLKLPMPNLPGRNFNGKVDVLSIFTLGVFSGIASACCAPVLVGILTFAFLSPNFLGSLLIGGMYVLGMVVPLLVISTFLSGKMPRVEFLRRPLFVLSILGRNYAILMSNLIAAAVFFITGLMTLFLTLTGRLSMEGMGGFTQVIQDTGGFVNQYVGENTILNVIFLGMIAYLLYRISKKL